MFTSVLQNLISICSKKHNSSICDSNKEEIITVAQHTSVNDACNDVSTKQNSNNCDKKEGKDYHGR